MSAAPRAGAGTVTLNVCWNSGHSKYIDGGSNTPSEPYLRTYGSELDGVAALYEEESNPHLEKRDRVKPCEDYAEELIENQAIGPAPPPPFLVSDAAGDFRMNTGADWSEFYAASAQDNVKPCEDYAGELIENQAIGPVPLPPLLVSDAAGDFSMNTGADWSTFYAESAQVGTWIAGEAKMEIAPIIDQSAMLLQPPERDRRR
ncbi:unnamed protein product [Dibothriocephalus latus]|uniref:Uncharacterized protein n=1 Tax=Dibothriocephalus latus TaxID=60516 RepID=A0A3P7LL78_DIBLA|nr:unnamed protein product [Dibothriocephalus latus]